MKASHAYRLLMSRLEKSSKGNLHCVWPIDDYYGEYQELTLTVYRRRNNKDESRSDNRYEKPLDSLPMFNTKPKSKPQPECYSWCIGDDEGTTHRGRFPTRALAIKALAKAIAEVERRCKTKKARA